MGISARERELLEAVRSCNPDAVASILDDAPQLARMHDGGPDHGRVIHVAASAGCVEVVELQLIAGADSSVYDARSRTPVGCAALAGHWDVVRVLCKLGVGPGAQWCSWFMH